MYLRQHMLARALRNEDVDPLLVEETALALVDQVLGSVVARHGRPAHTRLAEEAKELLAETLGESPALDELARRLNVSPFHLARVFRRETGYGLPKSRKRLRPRPALGRPRARGRPPQPAHELGFASHSHFTDSFRRTFGVPPSAVA